MVRVHTAVAEDPSRVPSTMLGSSITTAYNSRARGTDALFWVLWASVLMCTCFCPSIYTYN